MNSCDFLVRSPCLFYLKCNKNRTFLVNGHNTQFPAVTQLLNPIRSELKTTKATLHAMLTTVNCHYKSLVNKSPDTIKFLVRKVLR